MQIIVRLVAFGLVLAPAIAAAADAAGHGEGHAAGVGKLLWQGANLALLIGAIVYFGRAPIRDFFAVRRREIAEGLDRAASLLGEAEAKVRDWDRRMTRLDEEVEEIRRTTQERADAERRRILADAATAAARIRTDAATAVEQEVRRARASLRADAAQLAIDLAGDLLRQHVDDSDRRRLVDDFIAQVESAPAAPAKS